MTMRITRRLGALSLLLVGAVHLDQYVGPYRAIPTIGTLFLLNAIASALVGFGLLLPLERWLSGRRLELAVSLLAVAGVLIALGSLIALFISESGKLFGFSEDGYDTAIVFAIVTETIATLLLSVVAAISGNRVVRPSHSAGAAPTRRAAQKLSTHPSPRRA